MTQEDRELLLKDLCGRLPYKVKCKWESYDTGLNGGGILNDVCKVKTNSGFTYWDCYFEGEGQDIPIELVKPLLRPLSFMTKEEDEEYRNIDSRSYSCPKEYAHIPASDRIDWLIAHHFDFRNLIDKGLAIAVTEENNPYKD